MRATGGVTRGGSAGGGAHRERLLPTRREVPAIQPPLPQKQHYALSGECDVYTDGGFVVQPSPLLVRKAMGR